MTRAATAGAPVIGIIFLALAILKFLNGDGWVVWALLAFLFGGFGVFGLGRSGGDKS